VGSGVLEPRGLERSLLCTQAGLRVRGTERQHWERKATGWLLFWKIPCRREGREGGWLGRVAEPGHWENRLKAGSLFA
jgi:hypothetical protein